MRFHSLTVAVLFGISQTICAAVTRLSSEDRAALEHPANVQMLFSTRAIPTHIRRACARVTADHRFRFADPGKPFNVTDVGWDDRIPTRRLIWAARLPNYFVIHYERGGIGHSFHVLVVREEGSKTQVSWAAAASELMKDYEAFTRALQDATLDDRLEYVF